MIMRDSSIQCDQLNKKSDNNGIKGDGKETAAPYAWG